MNQDSVRTIADEAWAWLVETQPYQAIRSGVVPARIPTVSETEVASAADAAAALLARLRAVERLSADEDLAAILEEVLAAEAAQADHLWLVHVAAPYSLWPLTVAADMVVAPLGTDTPEQTELRASLTADLVTLVRSIAERLHGQHARGIAAPVPARPGIVETWTRLRDALPVQLAPPRSTPEIDRLLTDELPRAVDEVLAELAAGKERADERVGLAHLPGGEDAYRACVRRETTLETPPEELHQIGLDQCRELADRMAAIRARLGGPRDERDARAWIGSQPHLHAGSAEEVAERYRSVLRRAAPLLPRFFSTLPAAPSDVARLDPAGEAGMTFGYYEAPSAGQPVGRYLFNGSGLQERSQLNAVALILHELAGGHHLQVARLAEDAKLHPLQRHIHLTAFAEGWAEYASGLGWEMGLYDGWWDAFGRLSQERFMSQRLVVDTALNLGWWDLEQARDFMRANTLEGDPLVATETLRYATDMPAQALAYRAGFLAFQEARQSAGGADVRDVHEAMLSGGAVPLNRMQERVRRAALSAEA